MGVAQSSGYPDYRGVLHPTIWSPKLLVKFYKGSVLPYVANTDYEGEISKQGEKVNIRTTPDITINDHSVGQKLEFETPEPTTVTLDIDKGKAWAFTDDKITEAQSDLNYIEDWTEAASEELKVSVDSSVLGSYYADAHASNKGATAGNDSSNINLGATGAPLELTSSNVISTIINCEQVLDEFSVPVAGRYLVITPWMKSLIKNSELKDASLAGDGSSMLRSGRLGMIGDFTLYKSRNLSTTTDGTISVSNMVFGQMHGLTFASQLLYNKVTDNPFGFGNLYKGLQVFGWKVIKTEAVGHLYAYRG